VNRLFRAIPVVSALAALPALLSAQAQAAPTASGRWTANIRPTVSMSSSIGSSTKRMYGSITIVPTTSGAPGSWDVDIHLTNDRPSESLMWTISPGRCGSGSIPLAQPNQLPFLEVRANETADVTANVRFALDPSSSYHLDIYRDGTQQESVIACAVLKHSKGK
jgi:hypothetical protein